MRDGAAQEADRGEGFLVVEHFDPRPSFPSPMPARIAETVKSTMSSVSAISAGHP